MIREYDTSPVGVGQFEDMLDQKGFSRAVSVREPLADIYFVESYKEYNWANTDHHHVEGARDAFGSPPNMGLNLV